MMEMAQRQQLANLLEQLRQRLLPYAESSLREIPPALQQAVRAERPLGQITSSGLERVKTILQRLVWAIYYLNDANFPANYQPPRPATREESTQAKAPAQPIAKAEQTLDNATADSTTDSATDPAELDFGPFDPRRSNA